MGDTECATESYRAAIQKLRDFPNQRVQSEIEFGYFVARNRLRHLYQEALDAIDEFAEASLFAVQAYNHHLIKAVILNELGRPVEAKEHAVLALEASQIVHSGLRHHPTLGLVDFSRDDKINPRRGLHEIAVRLAQDEPPPPVRPSIWRILDSLLRRKT